MLIFAIKSVYLVLIYKILIDSDYILLQNG